MYHYTECGLDNVWLRSGYTEKKTKYGDAVAFEDVNKLHDEICHVLMRKSSRLSGQEFRFLRKELGFSQGRLGDIMGVTHQAVAIWEKSNKVPLMNDLFLRGLIISKNSLRT
ncbi:transcriptional regulator [Salmonella enterica]|nr:transcriptional regulator [Salmonella enterica]